MTGVGVVFICNLRMIAFLIHLQITKKLIPAWTERSQINN